MHSCRRHAAGGGCLLQRLRQHLRPARRERLPRDPYGHSPQQPPQQQRATGGPHQLRGGVNPFALRDFTTSRWQRRGQCGRREEVRG